MEMRQNSKFNMKWMDPAQDEEHETGQDGWIPSPSCAVLSLKCAKTPNSEEVPNGEIMVSAAAVVYDIPGWLKLY